MKQMTYIHALVGNSMNSFVALIKDANSAGCKIKHDK